MRNGWIVRPYVLLVYDVHSSLRPYTSYVLVISLEAYYELLRYDERIRYVHVHYASTMHSRAVLITYEQRVVLDA